MTRLADKLHPENGSPTQSADHELLKGIVRHYLSSGDFNGLPLDRLFASDAQRDALRAEIAHFVTAEQVTLDFGDRHPNPHIKAFPSDAVSEQLAKLAKSNLGTVCAYPTPDVLLKYVQKDEFHDRPFTRRLMFGEPQLAYHSFDLSILEWYRNDPRYICETDDIHGWISISDSSGIQARDKVALQTFGFGYDENLNRAVVVFNRYLHALTPEHQQVWNSKRLCGNYELHPDYFKTSIIGGWGTKYSLFQAFTEELKHINAMCKLIGKPPLFRNEFEQRPRGFSFLIRPTTKEFNDFVLLLDQMMSDNINRDFFNDDVELETETVRSDGKVIVTTKGTIQLLEQWFTKMMRFPDPVPFQEMVATFRRVRKLRQAPAHRAEDSTFDQENFKRQRELVITAYEAVRIVRLMLANHPSVRDYEVDELLRDGHIWNY
jgi:hypothetical protein